MTIKNNVIVSYEHHKLYKCDENCENCTSCDGDYSCCINFCKTAHFDELRDYYLNKNFDCGFDYILKENCIKFDKYTGIIQLQDGTYLEILPKLEGYSITQSRKIFENLVLASHNLTKEYKHNKDTQSKTNKNKHIAEIFVSVFCMDILKILKRGIKKSYIRKSENLCKYKGKLNFSEHIKHNIITKNKFFVDYNEFSMDIAENRILKSACLYLIKRTKSDENKKVMRRLLIELDDVSVCANLDKDIQNIQINRLHEYYTRPLKYAEFFLRQDNFIPNKGRISLPALLFPLNEMFEDYIENILKENKIKYYSQYKKHYLVHKNNKEFFITKMDFVILKENRTSHSQIRLYSQTECHKRQPKSEHNIRLF